MKWNEWNDVEKYRDREMLKGHSPCEFMYDPYMAEMYRPGLFFYANMGLSSLTST